MLHSAVLICVLYASFMSYVRVVANAIVMYVRVGANAIVMCV
jgi:hypothetical protein